jgi:carboxyl-terminal processing protease
MSLSVFNTVRWHAAVIVIAGTIAIVAAHQARARQHPVPAVQISSFERGMAADMLSQVHNVLKHDYYDPSFHGVDIDARYRTYAEQMKTAQSLPGAYRMIAAYLSGLDDSHTVFVPPPNANRVDYGYRMQVIGNSCFITEVRPGTDAAQKLRPGDQVLSLDGYAVNPKDFRQFEYYLNALAPQKISEFTLRNSAGIVRQESVRAQVEYGEQFAIFRYGDYRLAMEDMQQLLKSRTHREGSVLFWKLPAFVGNEGEIYDSISEARKHSALVLDLRGNPGGAENILTSVLGSLFDHDVTIGKKITREGEKPFVAKTRGRDSFTGQLVVLVDRGSESASEIVARVVQIEHRGTVVGDTTAGGVMSSRFFPLTEGANWVLHYGVQISQAGLIMADGKSLEGAGVTPDVIVLPTSADLAAGRDPALARAAQLAGVKLDPAAAAKIFPFEWAP